MALIFVSGLNARASFFVDFDGRLPSPPFLFNNEFLWDVPEPGLATVRTNQDGSPSKQETSLEIGSDPSPVPEMWDPSVPGSYEVSCMVVSHVSGLGAAALDFKYGDKDWSWTLAWGEFFVSLDVQLRQVGSPDTIDDHLFLMDTTDDFHCYRVDWDPSVPSATLFVDGENTGITIGADLLGKSRGKTELVIGDDYGGTIGGEVIFDFYSFESRVGPPVEICDDEQDNDQDGDTDCADAGCQGNAACPTGVGPFVRGDCDGNGTVGGSPTEAIVLLNFAFLGAGTPGCLAACDAEANGSIDVTDALRILRFAFLGLGMPDPPFPECVESGLPSDLELGCEVPISCP